MNKYAVILLFSVTVSQAYLFTCLDDCDCDTADEMIHCQNGERTELKLPAERLRGFPVIALTFNKIVKLPSEHTILTKFPDLTVIDIERNPDFDCSTLDDYEKVKIVSDCFKNATEIMKVQRMHRPTRECDFTCQAQKHYEQLHAYALSLWKILKEKYDNFDADETLELVKEFFTKVVKKINKVGKDINDHLENTDFHPKQVTPMPTLADIDV